MAKAFEKLKKLSEIIAVKTGGNVLGLIVTENSIAAVEIDCCQSSCRVVCSGQFNFTRETSLDNLPDNCSEFKEFLKKNNFKARKAVVGISAKYLIATSVDLPAVNNTNQKNEIVRMSLENKLNFEFSEIAFDYYSQVSGNQNHSTAVSTLNKYIDGIKSLLSDCGIAVLCVTGSSIGISLQKSSPVTCNVIVYPDTAEIVIFKDGALRIIKNFPMTENMELFAVEIGRILTLISDKAAKTVINIIDYAKGDEKLEEILKCQLENVEIQHSQVRYNNSSDNMLCELASEIAENYVFHKSIQIDLLHGHTLANGQNHIFRKIATKLGIACMIFVLIIGAFFFKWHLDNKKIIKLQQQLSSISSEAGQAKNIIGRVSFAKNWFSSEPRYLDILKALTLSFPDDQGVWLSTMAVDESMNQVITGKATHEEYVLDLIDNLNKSPVFENAKMLYMRKAGKNSDIITFAINIKVK